MFSKDAKKEIEEIILKFENELTEAYSSNIEIDFKKWIENYQPYISALCNGFKRLCFDNGDMVYYDKNIKDLKDLWERTKNKLLVLAGE